MRLIVVLVVMVAVLTIWCDPLKASNSSAKLLPAKSVACNDHNFKSCEQFDAVVFVHGIFGNDATFINADTGFDWPKRFPDSIDGHRLDVYKLDYQSQLVAWARGSTPEFDDLASDIMSVMEPLRRRKYRSIGFIAHSLGGNIVTTYTVLLTQEFGHPQRSENAYVITLATPVDGADIADIASTLKAMLGMHDDLLNSLKSNDIFLRMLQKFARAAVNKQTKYDCRPVDLYAAYEEKRTGPFKIVSKNSGADAIKSMTKIPPVGFPLNHLQIAKPTSPSDPIYKWVLGIVGNELTRLDTWDRYISDKDPDYKLCQHIKFIDEDLPK